MPQRGTGDGVFFRTGQHPAEQLFLAAFLHNADLQMETSQIGVRLHGMAATEDRTGNQPVFACFGFFVQQFIDIRANQRLHQTRVCSLRPTDGDGAFRAQLSGGEERTDGDDVLIIKMPDLFRQAHRLKEMDVRPDQTRRMRASKLIKRDLPLRMTAKLAATGLANVDFSGREAG